MTADSSRNASSTDTMTGLGPEVGGGDDPRAHGAMACASAWVIALNMSVRALGILSTIVLARLLVPADFGIVALAFVLIGFGEMVLRIGPGMSVIREAELTDRHLNAAWTLSILTGLVLGALAVLTGPLLAEVFNEPRAGVVIQMLSLRLVVGGFENIGVALLRRELNFRKDYLFGFITKAVAVVITIALAWTLRNYWALVLGSIAQAVVALLASYRVHPYRPALCFTGLGGIFRFSSHVFLAAVGNQLNQQADRILLGKFLGAHTVGIYHIGAELGRISTYDLVEPTARALFPNYARAARAQLRSLFLDAFSGVALLAIGAAAGFACVAEPAIRLLYGAAWAEAAPIAGWIAISSAILAISNTAAPVQAVTGHTKTMVAQAWVRLGLFVLIAATFAPLGFTAAEAAQWRVAAAALAVPLFAWGVSRAAGVGPGALLACLWRPLIAACAMTMALQGLQRLSPLHDLALPLSLGIQVLSGLAVYAVSALGLWLMAGRPDAVEGWLLGALGRMRRARRRSPGAVERGTAAVSASTAARFR